MKRIAVCFGVIYLVLVGVAFAQETKRRELERAVIIPHDDGLPVVAYQPDCPLQIEDIKLLAFLDGGGGAGYSVRHRGTKPIRSYVVGSWNSVGTGWELGHTVEGNLLPGQVSVEDSGGEVEIVQLTDSLLEKLKMRGGMRAIVVFMVVRVEYADGSVYDAEPLYKALQEHLNKVDLLRDLSAPRSSSKKR